MEFARRALVAALFVALPFGTSAFADLVSHFPFDGNIDDAGPGENHGTFVGGDPVFVEGFDGTAEGALLFDGTDDYVDVAPNSGLPISNEPQFTIAMWVNGPVQSDRRIFSEGSSTSNAPLINLGTHNPATGSLNSFLRPGHGHRPSARTAYDSTWHHVAWVDNNGQVDVYIDGVRDPVDFDYARVVRAVDRVSIGGVLRGSSCCWFAGAIDDVRIYNHALTEAEVQALIPTPGCPEEGDTHATGLTLGKAPLGGVGPHVFEATGPDDSGDSLIYTFFVTGDDGDAIQFGPQSENTFEIKLVPGIYTV